MCVRFCASSGFGGWVVVGNQTVGGGERIWVDNKVWAVLIHLCEQHQPPKEHDHA